jgi:hypothetical protein
MHFGSIATQAGNVASFCLNAKPFLHLFPGNLHKKPPTFSLLGGMGYLKAPMQYLFRGTLHQKGPMFPLLGG